MGGYGDVQMIDENGLRMDGRKPEDCRPIQIETGVIPVADGSAKVLWGKNEVIAAVYGPMEAHPRKIQRQDRARPFRNDTWGGMSFLIASVLSKLPGFPLRFAAFIN